MQIEQIDIWHVAMPLITPWTTAYGSDPDIHSVIVRIKSIDNEAWGESTPLQAPCYSPEWTGGIFHVLKECFAPAVVGKDIATGDELQENLKHFKGNQFAKAALDCAWWNLQSLITQKPLHTLLGGTRNLIEVGADFGVTDTVDNLLKQIESAVEQNFARVKLKVCRGWDTEVVKAVRKKFPDLVFHVDCNSGYTLDDIEIFKEFDDCNLAMIEQPLTFDDLTDHAKLQKQIKTPVCLDESLNSVDRARKAIELGSAKYFNIKPGRVGGITVAKQIHDLAKESQIPCWVGGMLESACGAETCIQLATLDNFTYAPDIFPSSKFYTNDMSAPSTILIKSPQGKPAVEVPQNPGNNSKPIIDELERLTVQKATIRS